MSSTKDDISSSYRHILKYTSVFGGVQVLNILIGLVRNKCVALLIGPGGFGLVALFNSTIKLISDATSLGLATSAVKDLSAAYGKGDNERVETLIASLRMMEVVTALVGMFVCALGGALFSNITFAWGNHVLHFVLLSPAVGCMAVLGGELAILKATRQLKALAMQSVIVAVSSLLLSVPIYYYAGMKGVVPTIVLCEMMQTVAVLRFSVRHYSYKVVFSMKLLGQSFDMVRLGLAFVVAGIIGSAVEFTIRAYLNNVGELETLGLYNAAYVMVVTYAGMVFSSMETDYYPRLSAIKTLGRKLNITVSRQIEVSLLLISPFVVAFIMTTPWILQLLFSSKFMPVLPMLQVAALSMYFRALYLPVEYISLARGDWRSFILLEAVSYGLMLFLMIMSYRMWNLFGCGIAITASYALETLIVYIYTRARFGFCPSMRVLRHIIIHLPLGICAYWLTLCVSGCLYWVGGAVLLGLSMLFSYRTMRKVI